jgi:hypothetical protein
MPRILTLEATQKAANGVMLQSCSAGTKPCTAKLAQHDTGKGQNGPASVRKTGVGVNTLIFQEIGIGV